MSVLRTLSAHYKTGQQRHSEQVDALPQRVGWLSEQVAYLDANEKTLTATLRALELMHQTDWQGGQ